MRRRLEDGKRIAHFDTSDWLCTCAFRKYLLPCAQIFHSNYLYGILSEEHWDTFAQYFEESGFEVYELTGRVLMDVAECQGESNVGIGTRLQFGELFERLRDQMFDLITNLSATSLSENRQEKDINDWVHGLETAADPYVRRTSRNLIAELENGGDQGEESESSGNEDLEGCSDMESEY